MAILKGNAVIGQSGGPTVVINQTLVGLVKEASKHSEIENIYGAHHAVQGILEDDLVDLTGEPEDVLERVACTPGAALGSVRKRPTEDECGRVFEVLKSHGVRYFFYIGGNDSAESASIIGKLARG